MTNRGFNLVGEKFGRLLVRKYMGKKYNSNFWECVCVCGNISYPTTSHLRSGNTKSCGCLAKEKTSKNMTIHGMYKSKEYACWQNMRNRCNNPKHPSYKNYGARGIKVCQRWNSFERFLKDMGMVPTGKSIERVDNDKDYSPDNCMWADRSTQNSNKRKLNDIIGYCKNGHPFFEGSYRIGKRKETTERVCKECAADRQRRYRAKKKHQANSFST